MSGIPTGKRPLVSVVIPCYNAEKYLRATIDSVLAQTYSPIEVIAVNDGSTDSSAAILESYGSRITCVHQKNSGVSFARNEGIRRSGGEFVAFCDADDIWLPHKTAAQMEIFGRHPEAGVVSSDTYKIDSEGRTLENAKPLPRDVVDRVTDLSDVLLMRGNVVGLSTAVIRKNLILDLKGFSTDHWTNSEDYDLWIRASEKSLFYITSEKLVKYRILENSALHGTLKKEYRPQFQLLYIHKNRYTPERYRLRRSMIYNAWAESSFYRREKGAWKLMRKAVKLNPWDIGLKLKFIYEVTKYLIRSGAS